MIEPYYQDEMVAIYHADCMDVLPQLPQFDLLLTDPPYGIGADQSAFSAGGKNGWRQYRETNWDKNRPDKHVFDAILAAAGASVIWGGNYFADLLPPSMGWVAWDKGQRNFSLADFEMAWTSKSGAARCFTYSRAKALRDGNRHPTQKPVALMEFCIRYMGSEPSSILDPFMGSGTTLVAARRNGIRAVGIDLDEKYCEIAASRVSQMSLFEGVVA